MFIKAGLDVQSFFERLKKEEIKYCCLRWFEELPDVVDGGDIDLLVSNDDVHTLMKYVDLKEGVAGSVKLDVYTVYGSSGTRYRGLPYYPPHFASKIISSSTYNCRGIRVPSDEMYFYSLAYHAVYQKKFSSGIPFKPGSGVKKEIKHDYLGKLRCLADKVNAKFDPTIIGIDKLLYEKGFYPGVDTLYKIGMKESWIKGIFEKDGFLSHHFPGFNLLVIRESGVGGESLSKVRGVIKDTGYSIVFEHQLDDKEKNLAKIYLRGGNWDNPGVYKAHGGEPAYFFGVYDYNIKKPSVRMLKNHPGTDNSRVRAVKSELRKELNNGVDKDDFVNYVHASNGALDAFYSVRSVRQSLFKDVFKILENGVV